MRVLFEHPARLLAAIFFLFLAISYLGLAWTYESVFLFNTVVHEDGKQTFLGLLFNPSHFVREIPGSVLMSIGCVGGFLLLAPASDRSLRSGRSYSSKFFWILALAIPICAIVCTTQSSGFASTWHELAQYKTRGESLVFGSHWQNHFLHMVFIPLEALAICSFVRMVNKEPQVGSRRAAHFILFLWAALFVGLWAVFGFPMEWANNSLYLAHQLREIGTHGMLSVPLILSICFFMEGQIKDRKTTQPGQDGIQVTVVFWISLTLTLLIPLLMLFTLRNVEILELAQKEAGYLELFSSHNFEHFIDYVFMGLLSSTIYLTANRNSPSVSPA